jgi:OmpA-OmpF porin, OOP family
MKSAISAILLATLIATAANQASAAASDEGLYATGAFGQSKYDIGNLPGKKKDNAYSVALGYQFNANVSAEIGYTDFGKLNSSGIKGQAKSTAVSLILTAPLSDEFAIYARLGAASTQREVSGFGVRLNERKTEAYPGIGARYNFTKTVGATLEYTKLNTSDVSAVLLGLRVRF